MKDSTVSLTWPADHARLMRYREWHHVNGRHYLTNMDPRYHDIIAEAIELSGRTDIHIDMRPMPPRGAYRAPDNLISIYVDNSCDCSDFWRAYDVLIEQPRWKTYLSLSS